VSVRHRPSNCDAPVWWQVWGGGGRALSSAAGAFCYRLLQAPEAAAGQVCLRIRLEMGPVLHTSYTLLQPATTRFGAILS